jgi:hypothetical protein
MVAPSRTLSRRTTLRAYARGADWTGFATAVSLHAHTWHSREVMSDLPTYIVKIPIVADWFRRTGAASLDFSKGYWRPPATPREVFDSETAQIDARFGLRSIVSITDHDDIAAGIELQERYAASQAPISVEWTVPFGAGFFHLGVHNLPERTPSIWFDRLTAFTAGPDVEPLREILNDLYDEEGVLLVLNHPLWDLAGVGDSTHTTLLTHFLNEHRARLHAIEINGYRSRRENGGVRRLAAELDMPLISGGDRHALAPNAVVNVTRAQSFPEFVDEIRSCVSHIVVMPEYAQHIGMRVMVSVADVMGLYGRHVKGRRGWMDRVWWENAEGVRPLSSHWPNGGPLLVRSSIAVFQIVSSPALRPLVGLLLSPWDPASPFGPVPFVMENS